MTPEVKGLILAALDGDIQAFQNKLLEIRTEVERLNKQAAETERRIAQLHELKNYANGSLSDGAHFRSTSVSPANPPPSTSSTEDAPGSHLSSDEIVTMAEGILEESKPLRAIDIAKMLCPNYDPEVDDRKFENRVFTVLKRRPEVFSKIGRGLWAVRSHFDVNGNPIPMSDQEEAESPQTPEAR